MATLSQAESDAAATDLRWRGAVIHECMDCYMKRTMSYDEFQATMLSVINSLSASLAEIATFANYDEAPLAAGQRASVTEDGKPIYYNRRRVSDPVQYSPPPAQSPGAV